VHHGVRIQDSALVAAATLANRYITDRFLPDKAIDLIDEAASQAAHGDRLAAHRDRRRSSGASCSSRSSEQALKKETDAASKERLEALARSSPSSASSAAP
jgi:ATP-dependent Clp protease ATP-binding subunit ClpB